MWLTRWSEQKTWKVKRGRKSEVWAFSSQSPPPTPFTRGGVSGMAQAQAEGVLNLSEKKWQDSLKLPSVLLMDSSVDMAGLETS